MATTITQPTAEEQSATRPAPRDFRQEVTDSIVRMLENGVAPWQKPWEPGANALNTPMNPTTGRAYRGGNAIHLMATAMRKDYEDPRWMTYKQAAQEGWQVRRGEKGTQIEFWDVKPRSEEDNQMREDRRQGANNTTDQDRSRLIHRVYTVFNAKQIDGIPPYAPKQRNPFEIVHAGEQILTNSGALIMHDQNDRAFYNRAQDTIHLPPKDAFKEPPGYYGTALHELAHWSGHPSRLNRPTLNESYRFGDVNYAKEELRAELASVFLAAERGIPHNPEQQAAYVGSWIKALRQDKNEIFRAANDASRASDFLLALERDRSIADEALTAGPVLDSATSVGARESAYEQEAAGLQRDREDLDEGLPNEQSATAVRTPGDQSSSPAKLGPVVRESLETTARYERGSATINVHAKQSGTDRRTTVDAAVNSPNAKNESGRPDSTAESLEKARSITARALGDSAQVLTAQIESGNYRGSIIGITDHYIIQRQSASAAVVHPKDLLDKQPEIGQTVRINYSNDRGSVREFRNREKANGLGR
ncbi:MAG: ArdC family protein [Bryobacteraceae bacterium]